jgi:hypothetical protein
MNPLSFHTKEGNNLEIQLKQQEKEEEQHATASQADHTSNARATEMRCTTHKFATHIDVSPEGVCLQLRHCSVEVSIPSPWRKTCSN